MPGGRGRLQVGALAAWLMLAMPLAAQVAPPALQSGSPVLILSQDRLFSDSLFGKAVQARADALIQELQAENRKIEADLEAEEKALTERRASLTPDEFRPLADAFDIKVEGIRSAQEAKGRELARKNEEERKRFFETAVPVLAALMNERGAVAILDKSAIVLSFDRIDITDAAIARIDAVLGDGSAPPVAPVVPTPTPEPTPTPAPAPTPAVEPAPTVEPAPAVESAPAMIGEPAPTVELAPTEAPAPAPVTEPAPAPAVEPAPKPVVDPGAAVAVPSPLAPVTPIPRPVPRPVRTP